MRKIASNKLAARMRISVFNEKINDSISIQRAFTCMKVSKGYPA